MRERSSALVVVGDEILSGKVRDTNAYFTARELRKIGVALKRIATIPDVLEVIAEEVRRSAQRFDFVLTSGGVGPTHDDVTMAGVAAALGRKLVTDPLLARMIRDHFEPRNLAAGLKMAEVPEGAVLNDGGEMSFPSVQVENVYVLPGIPQLFEKKLLALKSRFATDPFFVRTIYTRAGEGKLAGYLNSCLSEYPELMLGSYPRIGDPNYRVKLTMESKDRAYLESAFRYLIGLLPGDCVVKVE